MPANHARRARAGAPARERMRIEIPGGDRATGFERAPRDAIADAGSARGVRRTRDVSSRSIAGFARRRTLSLVGLRLRLRSRLRLRLRDLGARAGRRSSSSSESRMGAASPSGFASSARITWSMSFSPIARASERSTRRRRASRRRPRCARLSRGIGALFRATRRCSLRVRAVVARGTHCCDAGDRNYHTRTKGKETMLSGRRTLTCATTAAPGCSRGSCASRAACSRSCSASAAGAPRRTSTRRRMR